VEEHGENSPVVYLGEPDGKIQWFICGNQRENSMVKVRGTRLEFVMVYLREPDGKI